MSASASFLTGRMKSTAGCFVALALVTNGCVRHSLGPRTIPTARLDYNSAISRSWDEDLLLNVVRLQYRDSPLFVDVSSVTASYSLGRSASVGVSKGGGIPAEVTAGAGLAFNENPVIGYTYLHGEQFARGLLSPLAPRRDRHPPSCPNSSRSSASPPCSGACRWPASSLASCRRTGTRFFI